MVLFKAYIGSRLAGKAAIQYKYLDLLKLVKEPAYQRLNL